MDAKLKFATAVPSNPTTVFKDDTDDLDFGFTIGVMLTLSPETSIGVGFRSSLDHDLKGTFKTQPLAAVGCAIGCSMPAKAGLVTPEMVTVSVRQDISPKLRTMDTIEWSNWSRFDRLQLTSTPAGTAARVGAVPAGVMLTTIGPGSDDGWFYTFCLERDYNDRLTIRGGVAYEGSPVKNPGQRIFALPDSNRVWLSGGVATGQHWISPTPIFLSMTPGPSEPRPMH